ncbi:RsmB/NOP family class I SAM-dependent RNA methyltransferase [Actibacterium ureilyticum]|uniref:RsmB/NOP family class I SAM-dependent RNA methyltransferase n=1 Tax=Actibacterium ureilyticum TaxID=1590614 RepID=UPI000BAABEB7|nr:RsmB/NOP family class I SAM-dependent RNA methyltransferase [Actibacterium ureilyticum]
MTPGGRVAAAIEILDQVLTGEPAEKVLTNWARRSRFAGSGDRAAIRDLVFDALRCRRSFAALGGGETGRGLILGGIRAAGDDPAAVFTGEGHAPAPLDPVEAALSVQYDDLPEPVALDCPDWLADDLRASLGADFAAVMQALRHRAPVWLRVNLLKATRDAARDALTEDGIETEAHPDCATALRVLTHPRRVQNSAAYSTGLVELQDLSSQRVSTFIAPRKDQKILDYCAGGGGKSLALAAQTGGPVFAHDAAPERLRDLPVRAGRAGADIRCLSGAQASAQAPFDLVLCDVPCSGSGAWRRSPDGKWRFSAADLDRLRATQRAILAQAATLVAPGGCLAYATCSFLRAENEDQIADFTAAHPGWTMQRDLRLSPLQGGDGFYAALLLRA